MTTKTATKPKAEKTEIITITPPNFQYAKFALVGTAPYLQCRFPEKAIAKMRATMEAGSTAKKGGKKEPRNFEDDFQQAMHKSEEDWIGIPASAFRNCLIETCRMAGFQMTRAKMSIFVESDGLDVIDGTPLVKIIGGDPERSEMTVRIQQTTDIRVRPMWREWGVQLRLRYDADQFTLDDVTNLLMRAGVQCGVGEGRPFSKSSNGMGFGTFEVQAA